MRPLKEIHEHHARLVQHAREAGFAVQADKFGRGTFLCSETDTIERLMHKSLRLKPMDTAPKPKNGEYLQLLVLDSWQEMGKTCTGWKFVYWLDAFENQSEGWYGDHAHDRRNPVGWVTSTNELMQANPQLMHENNT